MPFPLAPKSLLAIFIPWAIAMYLLWFDFTAGYKTNPILLFGFPIAVSLYFIGDQGIKGGLDDFLRGLGLDMPEIKDKFIGSISLIFGLFSGWLIYYFITLRTNIVGLYFMPMAVLSVTPNMTSILAMYLVVAFGEEFMCFLYTQVFANKLSLWGLDKKLSIIMGAVLSRMPWAALHWFAYQGWVGVETLPIFLMAMLLGIIFSVISVSFAFLSGKNYFVLGAVGAHLSYDFFIVSNMAFILPYALMVAPF